MSAEDDELALARAKNANARARVQGESSDTPINAAQDIARAVPRSLIGIADLHPMAMGGLAKAIDWGQRGYEKYAPPLVKEVFKSFPEFGGESLVEHYQNALETYSEVTPPSQLAAKYAPSLAGRETSEDYKPFGLDFVTGAEYAAGGTRKLINKGANIIPDIAAGVGAMFGQKADEALDTNWIAPVTAISSALIAGAKGSLKQARESASPENRVNTYVKEVVKGTDQEALVDNLRRKTEAGEIGSVSQLTDNTAAASMEKWLFNKNTSPDIADEYTAMRQARTDQIAGGVSQPFGGEVADLTVPAAAARSLVTDRRNYVEKASGNRLTKAVAAENAGISAVDQQVVSAERAAFEGVPSPAEASISARVAVTEGKDVLGDEASELWNKFDSGPKVNTEELKKELSDFLTDALGKASSPKAKDFISKFSHTLSQIKALPKAAQPEDLSYIISQVKSTLENARKGNTFTVLEKELGGLNKVFDDYLADPSNSALYSEARAKTREMYKRYAIDKTKRDIEEFLNPGDIFGQKGAATARKYMETEDPVVIKKLEDYVLSIARKKGVTPEFLADHADLLARMPNLKGELDALSGAIVGGQAAKVGLTQAREAIEKKTAETTGKVGTRLEKSVLNRYANDVKGTVDTMLSSPEKISDFKSLYAQMKELGTADVFKADIRERVLSKVVKKKGGKNVIDEGAIDQFNIIRHQLEAAGIITSKEADDMTAHLARGRNKFSEGMTPTAHPERLGEEGANLTASVGAAVVLKMLGSQQSLMFGGALRRAIKSAIVRGKKEPDPKLLARLAEVLKDPKVFEDALRSKDPESAMQNLIFVELITLSKLTTDEEQEQ